MKKIIFIVALFMLIKPVLPVIDYVINYDYISTHLCENINKPELKCNGKCHLAKELAKASESEKPIQSDKKQTTKLVVEDLFCETLDTFKSNDYLIFETKKSYTFYQNLYHSQSLYSIFHPPILA